MDVLASPRQPFVRPKSSLVLNPSAGPTVLPIAGRRWGMNTPKIAKMLNPAYF